VLEKATAELHSFTFYSVIVANFGSSSQNEFLCYFEPDGCWKNCAL